jgi:hypothetical protein
VGREPRRADPAGDLLLMVLFLIDATLQVRGLRAAESLAAGE